jgi:chloride channel protein, CIC family
MTDPGSDRPGAVAQTEVGMEQKKVDDSGRAALSNSSDQKFFQRETNVFLLLAVIIGSFAGLAVVLFRITIDWIRISLLSSSLAPSTLRVILVPTLAGFVVAFLVIRFFPRARGSGVNQTKSAVYIYDGFIPFNTVIGKFILCSLAIGSGQSLGPEDPSLQMGAGIASLLGRRLQLTRERLRVIAPIGAAAGLAAAFNSPISAVLFVIEEVIGNWSGGVLGAIVLAAVSSVVVMRSFLGSESMFRIPPFHLVHTSELLAYAALGVIGGLFSLAMLRLISYARPRLKALPSWTHYVQPAAAGLLIGIIGIWLPQTLGAGYIFIDQAMRDQYTWQMLALLGAVKMVTTSISFTSGTPGGMFAPTLFIGAMIGGAVGGLQHLFFPWLTGSVGTYALVGMGVLFAGFLRVPMTSVFMVLELSGNYSIIVPVMVSNTIAYLISRQYQEVPLFDLLSRQDGIDLPSMEAVREESSIHVEDAMQHSPYREFHAEDWLEMALQPATTHGLVLVQSNTYAVEWYLVRSEDLRNKAAKEGAKIPLKAVLPSEPMPVVYPDSRLEEALRHLGTYPFVPVVRRDNPGELEGIISFESIVKALRAQ